MKPWKIKNPGTALLAWHHMQSAAPQPLPQHGPFDMLSTSACSGCLSAIVPATQAFATGLCSGSGYKRACWVHSSCPSPLLAGGAEFHAWGIAGHCRSPLRKRYGHEPQLSNRIWINICEHEIIWRCHEYKTA